MKCDMKDVAILTKYYKNYNYGGMLQGYALHRVITELGYSCDIVSYNVNENKNPVYKNVAQQCKQYGMTSAAKKVLEKVIAKFNFIIKDVLISRQVLFDKFMEMNAAGTEVFTDENLTTLNNEYKMFVSGSDQVWNPNAVRKLYLQGFVSDNRKKIAYAASIGRDKFSKYEADILIPYIKRFDYLGIREKTGKELLEEYMDRNIDTVLDPTLLLGQDEWSIVATERLINEPYALVYFFSDSFKVRKKLEKFCEQRGLKLVLIPYAKQEFNLGDHKGKCIRLDDVGPREFVSAIKYADYVFTDSFHGAVFSIIHGIQFFVFERNKKGHVSMNSRLYDLLDTFHLRNRLLVMDSTIETTDDIDYKRVDNILTKEKEKSTNFLKKALEG